MRLERRARAPESTSNAPWEIAQRWSGIGVPRLHVVDLDAAFARGSGGDDNNHATIKKSSRRPAWTSRSATGRVRTLEDCARLFNLGVSYVVTGTAAIKNPAMVDAACRWPQRNVGRSRSTARARSPSRAGPRTPRSTRRQARGRRRRSRRRALYQHRPRRDAHRARPGRDRAPGARAGAVRVGSRESRTWMRCSTTGATAVVIGKASEGVFTVEQALARVGHALQASDPLPGRRRRARKRRFKELRDAGDPVAVAAAYDEQGADDLLPRYDRSRRARHHAGHGARDQARVPAAHRRRRRARGRGRARCCSPAPTRWASTLRSPSPDLGGARPTRSAIKQSSWPSMRAAIRAAGPREVFTHGGRKPTGIDAVAWCKRMAAAAPAKSCSPA